jgi:hypothetical protein
MKIALKNSLNKINYVTSIQNSLGSVYFTTIAINPAADVDPLEIYRALDTVFQAYLQKQLLGRYISS